VKRLSVEVILRTKSSQRISPRHIETLVRGLVKNFRAHTKLKKATPAKIESAFLTVVFVSARESQSVNFRYRKKNYPTDVLSFSEDDSKRGLGELVLCPQILERQARELNHSFKKELDYMIIHGFLHLLGYDHEKSRREELKMTKLQDKLFSKLSK